MTSRSRWQPPLPNTASPLAAAARESIEATRDRVSAVLTPTGNAPPADVISHRLPIRAEAVISDIVAAICPAHHRPPSLTLPPGPRAGRWQSATHQPPLDIPTSYLGQCGRGAVTPSRVRRGRGTLDVMTTRSTLTGVPDRCGSAHPTCASVGASGGGRPIRSGRQLSTPCATWCVRCLPMPATWSPPGERGTAGSPSATSRADGAGSASRPARARRPPGPGSLPGRRHRAGRRRHRPGGHPAGASGDRSVLGDGVQPADTVGARPRRSACPHP